MHMQNLVIFCTLVLKILSGNEIMTDGMTDNPNPVYRVGSHVVSVRKNGGLLSTPMF